MCDAGALSYLRDSSADGADFRRLSWERMTRLCWREGWPMEEWVEESFSHKGHIEHRERKVELLV